MNEVSQVLMQDVSHDVSNSYCVLADHNNVSCFTLHHCACEQHSIEEKTQSQQYLTLWKENVIIIFLLQMSDLKQSI